MMISWKDVPPGTQFQTPGGDCYKKSRRGHWLVWLHQKCGVYRWHSAARDPDEDTLVPRPTKVGYHRGTMQYEMTMVGGPWDRQRVVVPDPSGGPFGLPVRVGAHYGRYNLSTGEWIHMPQVGEGTAQERQKNA